MVTVLVFALHKFLIGLMTIDMLHFSLYELDCFAIKEDLCAFLLLFRFCSKSLLFLDNLFVNLPLTHKRTDRGLIAVIKFWSIIF